LIFEPRGGHSLRRGGNIAARARLPKVPAKPFDLDHGSVTQKDADTASGRIRNSRQSD
jgi:hypothetical protein